MTSEPKVVGARVDWLEVVFRVSFSERVLRHLRARGTVALRDAAPSSLAIGGRSFRMTPPRSTGRWLLQNDACRVEVLEKAPGGEGDAPGWSVRVTISGTSMLALGHDGAIAEAWAVARALGDGDVTEARFGRTDLCADVAHYDLRDSDRLAFVKQRRVKSVEHWRDGKPITRTTRKRKTDGTVETRDTVHWQQSMLRVGKADEDSGTEVHFGGDTFTGFSFGSRKTVSARIYDKGLELRAQSPDKKTAEHEWWKSNGWDGASDVARVEFEVRGEALDELALRHPVRGEVGHVEHARLFASGLDELWSYMTHVWLRLERSGKDRVVQPRWRAVQAATFVAAAHPRARVRQRGAAKAAQARGSMMSFLGRTGHLPRAPWLAKCLVRDTGEIVDDTDAAVMVERFLEGSRTVEERHARSAAELRTEVAELFRVGAVRVADAELERAPDATTALTSYWTRMQGTFARFTFGTEVDAA